MKVVFAAFLLYLQYKNLKLMKNNYLNLEVDDMLITDIILKLKKRLKKSMSNQDFRDVIIDL